MQVLTNGVINKTLFFMRLWIIQVLVSGSWMVCSQVRRSGNPKSCSGVLGSEAPRFNIKESYITKDRVGGSWVTRSLVNEVLDDTYLIKEVLDKPASC